MSEYGGEAFRRRHEGAAAIVAFIETSLLSTTKFFFRRIGIEHGHARAVAENLRVPVPAELLLP